MPSRISTYFGNPDTHDGTERGAISAFPLASLRSARCSAVPLLTLWGNPVCRQQLLKELGLQRSTNIEARFEYRVPWHCAACGRQRPRAGIDSHTDLMLTATDVAVAIEAKYTEPRYEQVTKWLRKGSDLANRKAVLAHWLHLIQAKTEAPVGEEQLGSLVYQMVHRTASACAVATGRRRPVVAHLLFGRGAKRREEYLEDVQRAQAVLDPGGRIEALVIEVGVTPSPRVEELYERHRRRDRSTAEEVKAALLDGPPLYELDPPVTVTDSRRRPEEELSGRPRPRGTAS